MACQWFGRSSVFIFAWWLLCVEESVCRSDEQSSDRPVEVEVSEHAAQSLLRRESREVTTTGKDTGDDGITPFTPADTIAQEVITAAKAQGADEADQAATAIAAVVASATAEALPHLYTTTSLNFADALVRHAKDAGLTAEQVDNVYDSHHYIHDDHHDEVIGVWAGAAAARNFSGGWPGVLPAAAKVAAVVKAAAEAGFNIEQLTSAATDAAAHAALSVTTRVPTTTSLPELEKVAQLASSAGLDPQQAAAVVDAAEDDNPQEHEAIQKVLEVADITKANVTKPLAAGQGNINSPRHIFAMYTNSSEGRQVFDAVIQRLTTYAMSAADRFEIAAEAARMAAVMHIATTTTTTYDGVAAVANAAREDGMNQEQQDDIRKAASKMTHEQLVATEEALKAAEKHVNGATTTTTTIQDSELNAHEKVAAVVNAAAEAGMTPELQAEHGATAAKISHANAPAPASAGLYSPLQKTVEAAKAAGMTTAQQQEILHRAAGMSWDEQESIADTMRAAALPTQARSPTEPLNVTSWLKPGTEAQAAAVVAKLAVEHESDEFKFSVVPPFPSEKSRESYKERLGHEASGFHFKVSLALGRVADFIRERKGATIPDSSKLSLAVANFDFRWPNPSCGYDEPGFTDFLPISFYRGTFANDHNSCGQLSATSIDANGSVRFPATGDHDLFWLAGMFGSQHKPANGGDICSVKIKELVISEYRSDGKAVEYSICGGDAENPASRRNSYIGCPEDLPLDIVFPEKNIGQALKLCEGQGRFGGAFDPENCFAT